MAERASTHTNSRQLMSRVAWRASTHTHGQQRFCANKVYVCLPFAPQTNQPSYPLTESTLTRPSLPHFAAIVC